MTDPMPINLAKIEARSSMQATRNLVAQQATAKARFVEDTAENFNPAMLQRQQRRLDRFRQLEARKKTETGAEEKKIESVHKRTEEDLAQEYNNRNSELPANKLRALRESIREEQTAEEILEEVQRAFPDVTLADEALEFLQNVTQGALNQSITQARTQLNALNGREILAGTNVDAAAKNYQQKGVGQATDLRNLYRDITGNPRQHNQLFSELSNKYPFDQMKLIVEFLLKGLAYDLKSKGPSIQSAELMRLMTEMRNLQSILWVYLFFKGRMRLIHSMYKRNQLSEKKKLSFEGIAKEFIKLIEERYPSILKLLKQTEHLGLEDDLEKMIVLTQFRDAVRNLSNRLYPSLRHKQDILSVILDTLEELEEEEEENESV